MAEIVKRGLWRTHVLDVMVNRMSSRTAVALYDGVTALDFVGPVEVFARWPEASVCYVASTPTVRTDTGMTLSATHSWSTLQEVDVLVVPGSSRPFTPLADEALLEGIRRVARDARWVTSVCTGSSLLAAAEVLTGRAAATHWAFREVLAGMGVRYAPERVHVDGRFLTAAGVSAGIDMALTLTVEVLGRSAAEVLQLLLEYDPAPPVHSGRALTAAPHIVEAARHALLAAASGS